MQARAIQVKARKNLTNEQMKPIGRGRCSTSWPRSMRESEDGHRQGMKPAHRECDKNVMTARLLACGARLMLPLRGIVSRPAASALREAGRADEDRVEMRLRRRIAGADQVDQVPASLSPSRGQLLRTFSRRQLRRFSPPRFGRDDDAGATLFFGGAGAALDTVAKIPLPSPPIFSRTFCIHTKSESRSEKARCWKAFSPLARASDPWGRAGLAVSRQELEWARVGQGSSAVLGSLGRRGRWALSPSCRGCRQFFEAVEVGKHQARVSIVIDSAIGIDLAPRRGPTIVVHEAAHHIAQSHQHRRTCARNNWVAEGLRGGRDAAHQRRCSDEGEGVGVGLILTELGEPGEAVSKPLGR